MSMFFSTRPIHDQETVGSLSSPYGPVINECIAKYTFAHLPKGIVIFATPMNSMNICFNPNTKRGM